MSGFELISVESICSMCTFFHFNIPCNSSPQRCVKKARIQDSSFHERSFDEDEEIMGFNFRRGIRENY
jgi:hypothetical protein